MSQRHDLGVRKRATNKLHNPAPLGKDRRRTKRVRETLAGRIGRAPTAFEVGRALNEGLDTFRTQKELGREKGALRARMKTRLEGFVDLT